MYAKHRYAKSGWHSIAKRQGVTLTTDCGMTLAGKSIIESEYGFGLLCGKCLDITRSIKIELGT